MSVHNLFRHFLIFPGRVLSREVKRRLNPIPGEKVYALSSADKDGNVRQMDNNGNYFKSPTPEEVNNFVNQQLENSQKLTQNILANVQETLQNIGKEKKKDKLVSHSVIIK